MSDEDKKDEPSSLADPDPQSKEEGEEPVKLEEVKPELEGNKEGCATLMIKKAIIHRQRIADEKMSLYAKMTILGPGPDYEWGKDVKSCTKIAHAMDN